LLKHRIAELFLKARPIPNAGELMGSGRHPELADCRRVRFDIDSFKGKPRFRLIYRFGAYTGGRPRFFHSREYSGPHPSVTQSSL